MTRLDRNLPVLRGWDVFQRLCNGNDALHAVVDAVGHLLVVETDGGTFHGTTCPTLPTRPFADRMPISRALEERWCPHCASNPAAHVENWRLNSYATADQLLTAGTPIARRDAHHAALCISTVNDEASWNPQLRPFADQLNTLFNSADIGDALLDSAIIIAACTHLDIRDEHADSYRMVDHSWTTNTLVSHGFVADCYQHSDGDIHATIDRIADTLNAGRRTEAHRAADNSNMTPQLIVTTDIGPQWFARQPPIWDNGQQFCHTDRRTTAIFGPAVLAATTWLADTTRRVDIDPADVTPELLGSLCVCVNVALDSATYDEDDELTLTGDHVTAAIETAVALHR
jgi:hypothetical protein